ncbi:hypothetical protein EW146_g6051 [Bondarzewia mesenterica]|uniref:Uncharacterized protein n=1 Tax=Bondarzewia mesenterica TaxID=1095465 RepID=A0A4S4LRR0_9AGAM|nr:hypothetical protein EW146_g6051 [Bondarzewia mesenterica]
MFGIKIGHDVVFPAEFCQIVEGQIYKKKVPLELMKWVLDFAVKPRVERLISVVQGVNDSFLNYAHSDFIGQIEMRVATAPMQIQGCQLPSPTVRYGNDVNIRQKDGSWNVKNQKFSKPAKPLAWIVVDFSGCPRQMVEGFAKELFACCTALPPLSDLNTLTPGLNARHKWQACWGGEGVGLERQKVRWKKVIEDHKMLEEIMHNFLEISLAPSAPASLWSIPKKYHIIIRLWSPAFHCLLKNLRRSSLSSKIGMEHLQVFIYYAYTFYSGLLGEDALSTFKPIIDRKLWVIWHAIIWPSMSCVSELSPSTTDANISAAISSISVPARLFDLKLEKEQWRSVARNWYALGMNDMLGNGKLHYHLSLLSHDVEGEELRGNYHFYDNHSSVHYKQHVDKLLMLDRRWLRAFWAGEHLVAVEKGIVFVESQSRGQWLVEGDLAERVLVWVEEDRAEHEEEQRKRGTRWGTIRWRLMMMGWMARRLLHLLLQCTGTAAARSHLAPFPFLS